MEFEREQDARYFAKIIEDEILSPAGIDASFDFTDFVGKPGELDV